MARLGDLIQQVRGVSYKPEDIHNNLNDNSIVLLRANNIRDGLINFDDIIYIDKKRVHDNQLLRNGDILICASSGSKELVGKAAYINKDLPITFGAFCKVIRPQRIFSPYLGHFFDSPNYRKKISAVSAGANINNIRNEHIDELDILIPTLDMQQHISSALDKLNDIIFSRKQQLAKLDELVKSRFIELFGDPEHNTKRLPLLKLGQLCKVGSSKRIYQNEQSTSGIPFWRVSDLNDRIGKGKAASELFIPLKKYEELRKLGLVPKAGDILITSRGTIGKCYIVKNEDKFYFQDGMISWLSEIDERVMNLYIAYLFDMSGMQKQIASLQAGSTVAYLSISMLKQLDIMLPPLSLQEQFATFIHQIDKSKLATQQSLNKLEMLKKSLMQKYF